MTIPTTERPPTNSRELRTSSGRSTRSRSYDPRGNSTDRRRRKEWMLSSDQFKRPPGSKGRHVFCTHCGSTLTYSTVEADKKNPAGTYRRDNVQPACRSCNIARSNDTSWVPPNAQ